MKKFGRALVFIIVIMMLVSCSRKQSEEKEVNNAEGERVAFQGKYISNDESSLTITENEGKFDVIIDIVGLTHIDDGLGEVASNNEINFCATDAADNHIYGQIHWIDQDSVVLKFTESTWSYLPTGTMMVFCRTEDKEPEENQDIEMPEQTLSEDFPVAWLRASALDSTFTGYYNQTGASFFELSDQASLNTYYLKKVSGVRYYYGTNDTVIGVNNGEISLVLYHASDFVGHTSPRVREVINALGAHELFEIQPKMIEVNNSHNSQYFFYWKIENGYVGFTTIGGNALTDCYDYVAYTLVLFEDISSISGDPGM